MGVSIYYYTYVYVKGSMVHGGIAHTSVSIFEMDNLFMVKLHQWLIKFSIDEIGRLNSNRIGDWRARFYIFFFQYLVA